MVYKVSLDDHVNDLQTSIQYNKDIFSTLLHYYTFLGVVFFYKYVEKGCLVVFLPRYYSFY